MTPLSRSSPEEGFLWTLASLQRLIHQQKYILSEYVATLAKHKSSSLPAYLTIERPKIVKRDFEMNVTRRREMESLRKFQKSIEKKLDMSNLYAIFDL